MMLSTDLHLVAMLDDYVAPQPVTAGFVRQQLLQHESEVAARRAVQQYRCCKKPVVSSGFYQRCLSHSGLDFDGENPALTDAIASGLLYGHLTDLGLGHYVKTSKIQRYTEFHSVRHSVSWLVSEWVDMGILCPDVDLDHLWWDACYETEGLHCPWIPLPLKEHPGFYAVFDSWLEDSNRLQAMLEGYETNTEAVNNPGDVSRVLPESVAIKALELVEVCLGIG